MSDFLFKLNKLKVKQLKYVQMIGPVHQKYTILCSVVITCSSMSISDRHNQTPCLTFEFFTVCILILIQVGAQTENKTIVIKVKHLEDYKTFETR